MKLGELMMPDYMEALISQKGLPKILDDLRVVVIELATNSGDERLWLLEQDLLIAANELREDYE